jgi:hypothetical protein
MRTSQPNTTTRAAKGIELILGWPKAGGGSQVQSVLFSRDTWDVAKAKKWLKQHGYRSLGLDVTEGKIRARQMEPGKMDKMRTKEIGNPTKGMYLVMDPYSVKKVHAKTTTLESAEDIAQRLANNLQLTVIIRKKEGKETPRVAVIHSNKAERSNPGNLADAEEMSSKFHGRDPEEIIDLLEPEKYHSNLTKLGNLRLLEVVLPGDMESGKVVPIQFAEDGDEQVELACTPDGQQLLLLAGDQTLDLEALEVPIDLQAKDYIEVGMVHSITYFTDKHHLEGPKYQKKGCEYRHEFAEEKDGINPDLVYDTQNSRMMLTGGTYKVEERGIVN